MTKMLLTIAVAMVITAPARADTITTTVDIENFGIDGGGDGSPATPSLIASVGFILPDIDSLDAVGAQLSHAYGSDVTIELIAPTTTTYLIVEGQGSGASPFQGGFDSDDLGDGGGFALANIVDYVIVPAGLTGTNWLNNGSPLPSGTYDQRLVGSESWATGPFAAGTWTLNIYDAWDTADGGSLGDVSLTFSPTAIPEQSSLVLLGLVMIGLIASRRLVGFQS